MDPRQSLGEARATLAFERLRAEALGLADSAELVRRAFHSTG